MAYYGYHRISTKEQHLDRGIIEIKRFCENQKIKLESIFTAINEQISNFAQSYPANSITASIEAPLLINRYRFVSCSCFSCFCKKA